MQLLYKDKVAIAANTTSTDLLNQKRVKTIPNDYPVYAVRFYSGSAQQVDLKSAVTLALQEALFVGSDNLIEQSPAKIITMPIFGAVPADASALGIQTPYDGFPGPQHVTIEFFAAAGATIQLNVVNVSAAGVDYLYAVELLPADTGDYDMSQVLA